MDIAWRHLAKKERDKIKQGCHSPSGDRPNFRELRIVLLGKSLSENISVRNSILGIDMSESEAPTYCESERMSGTVKNRNITLINSSHLLQLNLSEHQITQAVKECVSRCAPGPNVFILVLQSYDFSEEDEHRVKFVLNCFSDQAMKRTILLMTDEVMNRHIIHLIEECGGGRLQFDEDDPTWPSEMFIRVDEILKEEPEEHLEIYAGSEGDIKEKMIIHEYSVRSEEDEEDSSLKDDGKPKESHKKGRDGGSVSSFFSVTGKSKLNLVLCGTDASLKVSMSKLLQGKMEKSSNQRELSSVCVKKEEKIHGHQISLVELPALTQLSKEEIMHQTLHCVYLCDPGVHVFLLIVPVGPLTDEDKAEVEKIQKIFGTKEHLMMIFTTEFTVDRTVTDFVKSSTETHRLINLCRNQYRVMELKGHDKLKQIPELLDYIESIKTEPYSLQMYVRAQENRVRHETEEKYKTKLSEMKSTIKELEEKIQSYGAEGDPDDLRCLRIVLIGRTGCGKSATGNTILGGKEFHSQLGSDSVTTVCQKRVGDVDGRSVAVVDTPGLFDTTLSNEKIQEEIVKCVSLSAPGPHAFIIVLRLGRFTQEETEAVDLIKKIFAPKAAQFSIVLFTGGDDLEGESIEDYVRRTKSGDLKKLIRDCGNRFLVFNNREKQDRTQVTQLVKMIEMMITTNTSQYFTNSMFEEAEMAIKKRVDEILKEREREIEAQNEKLKVKYETEMEQLKKRLEEEKRRAEEERQQTENKFRQKEEDLRTEFEEKEKSEQQKREREKLRQLEEEEKQRAEYHQKIEEMKRETEHQRSQYEKQQKEREEEDRRREEKYRQEQEKMKQEQEQIIAELQMRQEEDVKKRHAEEQWRSEEEKREREEWMRKIKEAENDKKEIQEKIKQQQTEWEEDIKQQMREREEEERKRKERHEGQLREKQEELEKMRKKFDEEIEKERQKREEERDKQRREREQKEREYEEKKHEMMKHYEQLERERKEQWERKKREDDERREEERKRWEKIIEDLKDEQMEDIRRREAQERERKEREETEREKMMKEHDWRIKEINKKHEDEARKQAEELNEFRGEKEQHVQELNKMLEERRKQQELLEKLYQHFKKQKGEETDVLRKEIEQLRNKSSCVIL